MAKKLTVKDVAKEAGVSTATISRVMNNTGYVSERVRAQVNEAIERLHYQPNLIARSLKQKKTDSIGIIVPDMTNLYFMRIARQIQRRCKAEGYHLLFMDSEEDPGKEREALNFLMEKRVEAIMLAGTGQNVTQLLSIIASGIHVVLVDRKLDQLPVDVVAEDSRAVSEEAIAFLLGKGHRHIGVINGPGSIVTARERYAGVMAGFHQFGRRLAPEYVHEGDFSRRSGAEAIRRLMRLAAKPTAIFSANNEMSYGVYLGLHEMGIPMDEVEVVSFGDLEFSPFFANRLSVIMQNPEEIGELAGDLVLKRLADEGGAPERRLLYPQMLRKASP